MGYHKRNRIVYNGVKGERIEVTRPVKERVPFSNFSSNFNNNRMKRKKKKVYLGAASYEKQKIADLAFAVLFLTIGIGFIAALILL